MLVTRKETEYKVGGYRVSIETEGDKSQIFVFDGNNNLILSCLSFSEAKEISKALLEVVNKELDIANANIPF